MNTKLYRSTTNRMIGGVCAGLGTYLGLDPVLVRIFFLLLAFGSGAGVLIYLLLWILIPAEDQTGAPARGGSEEIADRARAIGEDIRAAAGNHNPQSGLIIGAGLVLLGLVFLIQNLHVAWLSWLDMSVLWPLLLIAGGAALIWRRTKGATL